MKELLIVGEVEKEFNKLGVEYRETYKGEENGVVYDEYRVCEVTEEEFKILCDDAVLNNEEWEEGGWRYSEGSNQGETNNILKVNGEEFKCWYEPDEDELEELEEGEDYYRPEPSNLLEYLFDVMGCSAFRNVCALTKDLSKYNKIKLSELFKKYQG